MENQPAKGSQVEREDPLFATSEKKASETKWAYHENHEDGGFWQPITNIEEIVRFRLTAERHATFEGFLLPEHVEDILQDVTYLHMSTRHSVIPFKWSNMFLQAIQTSENPAPFLQILTCDFYDTRDSETLISRLQYLQDLRFLDLSHHKPFNHFNLAQAMELGQLRALETLDLRSTYLNDAHCEVYASALQSGRVEGLSQIDFSWNEISDSGASALARAFQSGHIKNLKKIKFEENRIGDEGMVALGSAFASGHMRKLEHVNLNGNGIHDKGMVHLLTVLETGKLPSLHSLYLSENYARDAGIYGLAKALESGNLSSLQKLDIGWYELKDQEFEPLVQAVSCNPSLILDIKTGNSTVDGQLRRQRELNTLHNELLSAAGDRTVPAKFGKVYLCGNPLVGKTTLRRSLERSKLRSLFTRETGDREEPRTRGIDVCQITSKGGQGGKRALSLAVWDVAGQHDYHMVHNAFLRDLASSKANATIFVAMCSSSDEVSIAEQKLESWLRFIASSVSPISPNRRDVFIVVNRMRGNSAIMGKRISNEWKCLLQAQAKKFENCLKIKEEPFIIDARKRRHVQHFKKSLIKRNEEILESVEVPEICDLILNYLKDWIATRKHFPVLPWTEVQSELRKRGANWPEEILHIAFKYLNEVGSLIFVDKVFSNDWLAPKEHLVVANPTWLCKEILGSMFLPENQEVPPNRLFRSKVSKITGSILVSDFKTYFRWSDDVETPDNLEQNQLLSILLWLGVCFLGHEENIIIPALISADDDKRRRVQGLWNQSDTSKDRKGQWIMGFSVQHVISNTALAPMALWHRFQATLARNSKFNDNSTPGDNDFVAGQYYVTFKVEYMDVFIHVNENVRDQPSFESIEVLVKPLRNAKIDGDTNKRKQEQVDIAGYIVKLLVDLWDDVCPGVGFIQQVVWPWPISTHRPKVEPEKNCEVAKLKIKLEAQDCWGQEIQVNVGEDGIVTWDQLLSTSDKERMKNYVSTLYISKEKVGDKFAPTSSFNRRLWEEMEEFKEKMEEINENVLDTKEDIRKLSQMFKEFDQIFFEDKQSTCPKVMYMGEKNLSVRKQIKDLMAFPIASVHLHFLCEAFYDEKGHGVHVVIDQEGIDVRYLKHWAKKLAPWIKYSVLILVELAKIGSNFVIPGLGLAIPSFVDWQQALSLSDGIIAAVTGCTEKELDEWIVTNIKGKGKGKSSMLSNPEELYGHSRKVMTEILGKLKAQEYKEKLGLLKVRLCSDDGPPIGVRWICYECLHKYKNAGYKVSELSN